MLDMSRNFDLKLPFVLAYFKYYLLRLHFLIYLLSFVVPYTLL